MDHFLNLVDPRRWGDLVGRGNDASGRPDTWGFTKRSRVQAGDLLVCLLMERQMWCGVLEALGNLLPFGDPLVKQDPKLPLRFPVEALVILHANRAIDVFHLSVWPFLSKVKAQRIEPRAPGWNIAAGLRVDPARLDPVDGALLVDSLAARRPAARRRGHRVVRSGRHGRCAGSGAHPPLPGRGDAPRHQRPAAPRRPPHAVRLRPNKFGA